MCAHKFTFPWKVADVICVWWKTCSSILNPFVFALVSVQKFIFSISSGYFIQCMSLALVYSNARCASIGKVKSSKLFQALHRPGLNVSTRVHVFVPSGPIALTTRFSILLLSIHNRTILPRCGCGSVCISLRQHLAAGPHTKNIHRHRWNCRTPEVWAAPVNIDPKHSHLLFCDSFFGFCFSFVSPLVFAFFRAKRKQKEIFRLLTKVKLEFRYGTESGVHQCKRKNSFWIASSRDNAKRDTAVRLMAADILCIRLSSSFLESMPVPPTLTTRLVIEFFPL